MSEQDWSSLKHPWQRLRWARLHWQGKSDGATTMRAAAESMGMQENTYSAYERDPDSASKATELGHQMAMKFGRKFKVNWVWILTGEETPFSRTPAQERMLQLLAETPEDTQDEVVDMMEAVVRRRVG